MTDLSTKKKVKLVEKNHEKHGLNLTLSAVELPKSTWYYWKKQKEEYEERYSKLKPLIREVIDENPEYGRPRITCELNEKHGVEINHKVVGRLLNMWDLKIFRAARKTGKSAIKEIIDEAGDEINLVKKKLQRGEEIKLFEVLYTDFTVIQYAGGDREVKLMPIIGHVSKLIFGWAIGKRRCRAVALEAWKNSRQMLDKLGVDPKGLIIHNDQDSVYKSDDWLDQIVLKDEAKISFSENGAKGNTYMESFNGHFKGPIKSLLYEAESIKEVLEIIEKRVDYWNNRRRHSSLGQIAPIRYIKRERRG